MTESVWREGTTHLWKALQDVQDPEFPMSIVDMGLVVDLQKVGRSVQVKMTFTAMGCPCMEMIMEDTCSRLLQEPDVEQVDIQVVWSPVWTKQRMTEQGREIMQLFGVTV
ncbi:MAG: metal-sulfur cluster assembly factor [Anaerolineales bacterium]|nr:metal-sulfur cluster assembly factor [Anaerolineales bacterium]